MKCQGDMDAQSSGCNCKRYLATTGLLWKMLREFCSSVEWAKPFYWVSAQASITVLSTYLLLWPSLLQRYGFVPWSDLTFKTLRKISLAKKPQKLLYKIYLLVYCWSLYVRSWPWHFIVCSFSATVSFAFPFFFTMPCHFCYKPEKVSLPLLCEQQHPPTAI